MYEENSFIISDDEWAMLYAQTNGFNKDYNRNHHNHDEQTFMSFLEQGSNLLNKENPDVIKKIFESTIN